VRRPVTELEGTVLGLVWARQPCTPYQVRREFAESPSPHWSGSAGAIYPLMRRLEAAALLRSSAHATGRRRGRRYRLTPAGRRALVRWIGPPHDATTVGVPPDPLRTRIPFLPALPAKARARFLEEAESAIRAHLAHARADLTRRKPHGPYFTLMAQGAITMLTGRLEWVRAMRAHPDA
jgi:DNA-binding PadR family transcriptional regulator